MTGIYWSTDTDGKIENVRPESDHLEKSPTQGTVLRTSATSRGSLVLGVPGKNQKLRQKIKLKTISECLGLAGGDVASFPARRQLRDLDTESWAAVRSTYQPQTH